MPDRLVDRVRKENAVALVKELQREVNELRRDLYFTRQAVFHLMPEQLQEILDSYSRCNTRAEAHRWESGVIAQLLGHAKRLPADGYPDIANRAYCPLCGRGSSAPYDTGFSLPEGLSRHLRGYGNVRQCDVMQAMVALARDHWKDAFERKEEQTRAEEVRSVEARKAGETLYRVVPDRDPLPLAEGPWSARFARNPRQLKWAEARLAEIGFERIEKEHVISYTRDGADFTVFADPRVEGRISFRVFKKPLPKKHAEPTLRSSAIATFDLLDTAKHALREKYEKRLAGVLPKLRPEVAPTLPKADVITLRRPQK